MRPGDEQPHCVRGRDVRHARRGGRAIQRRNGPAHLAGNAEDHPAGDDDPLPVHRGEQRAGQLRRRRRAGAPPRPARSAGAPPPAPRPRTPRRAHRAGRGPAGSLPPPGASDCAWRTDSSGMNATDAAGSRRRIASMASRVLPAPPGPTRLTSRERPSSPASSASSRSRPMKLDWATGSPVGRWVSAVARASNSARARLARADIWVRPDSHRLTVANDTPSCRASCSWDRPRLVRNRCMRSAGESGGSPPTRKAYGSGLVVRGGPGQPSPHRSAAGRYAAAPRVTSARRCARPGFCRLP